MATQDQKRDHGGNLDAAMARFGGAVDDWLDLSTGINPEPYPVPDLSARAWSALPTRADMARLIKAARAAYECSTDIIATNGAQGAIQIIPGVLNPGRVAVVSPTYNEHQAAFSANGWRVSRVDSPDEAKGFEAAVIVNPNNPDGRRFDRRHIAELAAQVQILIVDESFADTETDLSLVSGGAQMLDNTVILRSFGKFYGLAGLRLGFAIAQGEVAKHLAEMAGPWPVSGPAIEIASAALVDRAWQDETRQRLQNDAARLDALALRKGWTLVGGTPLFRTFAAPSARQAQNALANHRIWSRVFPYSDHWIRLGLPPRHRWQQLEIGFSN